MKTKIVGNPESAWACVVKCPNKSDYNICLAAPRRKPPFECQKKPNKVK